jgi:hypothetical protein
MNLFQSLSGTAKKEKKLSRMMAMDNSLSFGGESHQ